MKLLKEVVDNIKRIDYEYDSEYELNIHKRKLEDEGYDIMEIDGLEVKYIKWLD